MECFSKCYLNVVILFLKFKPKGKIKLSFTAWLSTLKKQTKNPKTSSSLQVTRISELSKVYYKVNIQKSTQSLHISNEQLETENFKTSFTLALRETSV